MPAAADSLEVREVKRVGRGGHLYKNDATPAVSMEVRREEKEVILVGRGGHLYKNGAMPARSMEVMKEEVGEPWEGKLQ